jgi:hypothetical protein
VGYPCLEELVDLQSSSPVCLKTGRRQAKYIRVALTPHRIKKSVSMNGLATLKVGDYSISLVVCYNGHDFLPEPKDNFELTQMIRERFGNLPVDEIQNLRVLLNQRYSNLKGGKHRGVFEAYDAAADNNDFAWEIRKLG